MSTPTREQIDGWIAEFVDALNARWQAYCAEHYPTAPTLALERYERDAGGVKYARIVKRNPSSPYSGSAEAFVDLTTGDVLKPDGWKRPAKGVRFRLADDESRAALFAAAGDPYYLYVR